MPLLLASLSFAFSTCLSLAGIAVWCLGFGPEVLMTGLRLWMVFAVLVVVTMLLPSPKRP